MRKEVTFDRVLKQAISAEDSRVRDKVEIIQKYFHENKINGEVWTVHDEIMISCPEEYQEEVRKILLQ